MHVTKPAFLSHPQFCCMYHYLKNLVKINERFPFYKVIKITKRDREGCVSLLDDQPSKIEMM